MDNFDLKKYLAEGKLLKDVDKVPVEDLFDENGFALKDMVIVYDQRDDMYLMDAEDMEKYH
jgi:translation elongation factor P/translation initiation factor 5A